MKKRVIFILVALIFFTFNSSILAPAGGDEKETILAGAILHSLVAGHYQQKEINDDFSEKAYQLFLKSLDYNKRFFTKQDLNKLNRYEKSIDDEFKTGSYELMKSAFIQLDKRIREAEVLTEKVLSSPFDFTVEDYLETDPDKYDFPEDKKEWEARWKKYLKFQTLVRLNDLLEEQEKAQNKKEKEASFEEKSYEDLEKEARQKVKRSQENWIRRMNQLNETDKLAIYLNAVLSTYDPHSNYFPPRAKENFDIQLSGQLEGIGATLLEKDGYIKVQKIVPGSASWRQGDLKAGDIILKVAQGEEEPVDIVNMRLDDAVQLIRGKKGTEVRLTVKKMDGNTGIIPIVRDIVELEETYAKSAIINNKVGYIKLPQFYADFNHSGGRSCAVDVANEIEKLKKDSVSGIILDLRNNGGGSLKDVVEMAGLFIEKGPVVQVRASNGALEVLEDRNPSIQYKGPLTILVNELSASASEILAAAMQDYHRAVIIGSHATYGKGTVQRMVDLDMIVSPVYSSMMPFGAIKLTTQKFYRINGGATQLKGVASDVVLPDDYTYLKVGENELDYPMPWDEIKPVYFKKWKNNFDLATIKADSKARMDTSSIFKKINQNALRLKNNSEITRFPLQLEKYTEQQEKLEKNSKKYKNILHPIPSLEVSPLQSEILPSSDTAAVARQKEWFNDIKKDVYIFEATKVLHDMN